MATISAEPVPPAQSERPALRLITDVEASSPGGLSPAMRLGEFYRRFFERVVLETARANAQTLASYRESVAHWQRITGDPPLAEINDFTCAEFAVGLAALPGRKDPLMAVFTIRKHVRNVQRVLNHAGPRIAGDRTARRNQSLLGEVPLIERPAADLEPPDGDFTIAETVQILQACGRLPPRAPRAAAVGVSPGTWWRALIVFLFYTGLRIGATMRLEWSMLEGEWIRVPSRTSKQRRGKKQFFHPEAREAIEPLRRGQALIFAWPNWIEKQGARRSMRRVFECLLARAGLPEQRRFGFHAFRKEHATELASINPLAAQMSLGHTDMRTTQQHYVNPRITAAAIQQMPSLRAAEKTGDTRQMRLFD